MTLAALLIAGALFVAYANGANDNFKGVATLYGSGTVGYRGALAWATATTFAGSLCSVLLAQRLVSIFSAKGLVPDEIAGTPEFLAAVAIGAASTVFLATLIGRPISTHVSCGSLFGMGIVTGQAGTGVIRQVVASCVLTLPIAALLASAFILL